MCFVWILEQTAIISQCSLNSLVCITETESVHCTFEQCIVFLNSRNDVQSAALFMHTAERYCGIRRFIPEYAVERVSN